MEMEKEETQALGNASVQAPFSIWIYLYNLYMLLVAYATYHKTLTTTILVVIFIFTVLIILEAIAKAGAGHHNARITHDYTRVHSKFELKFNKVDHWCLQGDDHSCRCEDPSVPMSHEELTGWMSAFNDNKKLANPAVSSYDVVFVGDETVEEWNERWLGEPLQRVKGITRWWKKKFTLDGGGDVEGLALGIAGDTIPNLLWRLQKGEITNVDSKIWWISVGMNDFLHGQCSEEVVLLGVLRLAEEISFQKPGSIVVLNSLLPRKVNMPTHHGGGHFPLWPSIQVVNEQMSKFCAHQKHDQFRFYDATPLFLNKGAKKDKKKKKSASAVPDFNPNLVIDGGLLTLRGHKIWGDSILTEVKRIMFDTGLDDDVTGKGEDDFTFF